VNSDWLAAHIPAAERFDYEGRHVPSDEVFSEIFGWLRD
jgi:predicted transcriptional regulator